MTTSTPRPMFDVHGNAIAPDAYSLEPLGDRLVIEPIQEADVTRGGILKPDIAKESPQEGLVLAAGPGRMNDAGVMLPMPVQPGDRVLYGKYSGTRVTVDEREVLVIRVSDVLARMVPQPAPLKAVA